MKPQAILAFFVSVFCAACSLTADQTEHVAESRQALTGFPTWGSIPYPVVTTGTTPAPTLAADGKTPLQAWDGSMADLVAADALAQCAKTSAFWKQRSATFWGFWNDDYFAYLGAQMQLASCVKPATANFEDDWLKTRTNPACNVDAAGNKAALQPITRDTSLYDTFNANTGYGDSSTGQTGPGTTYRYFNDTALGELSFADVNLCVAQQIRQYLNDGNVLFTPTNDQIELLSVLRQRSQMAMIQYSVIASSLSSFGVSQPSNVSDPKAGPWIPIHFWTKTLSSANLQKLAGDWADAIALQVNSTNELAELLTREAAAKGHSRTPYSPRGRLLSLMFGGDPRVAQDAPFPPGQGPPGPFNGTPSIVQQSMTEPQIETAIRLLRKLSASTIAPTIRLVTNGTSSLPNYALVDVESSLNLLYGDVEARLLMEECQSTSQPSCVEATFRSSLPPIANYESYELWKRHRIAPKHMRAAITALAQALGRDSSEVSARTASNFVDPAMHITGQHADNNLGNPSVHLLDPNFGVTSLRSNDVGEYYQYGAYLDDVSDYGLNYVSQNGAGSNWSISRAGIYKRYLYTGAIPALAYVKEQILQGGLPTAQAFTQPFFTTMAGALTFIEKAIGTRSILIRQQGSECSALPAGTTGDYTVKVITRNDDPAMSVYATTAPSPELRTLGLDPNYASISNGKIPATTPGDASLLTLVNTAPQTPYTGVGSGWVLRTTTVLKAAGYKQLFVADNMKTHIMALGGLIASSGNNCTGKYLSLGGSLNALVDKVWASDEVDWSKPAYDGLGLPRNWYPPSNASLAGGSDNEETYEYYLRSAKEAAAEATAAVKDAIDSLTQQTLSDVELKSAETKAQGIADLETTGLCGAPNCTLSFSKLALSVPSCAMLSDPVATNKCNQVRDLAQKIAPSVNVGTDVVGQLDHSTPDFSKYGGSDAGKVLLHQWQATRTFNSQVNALVELGNAYGTQVAAAASAEALADGEYDEAYGTYKSDLDALNKVGVPELSAQIKDAQLAKDDLDKAYSDALAKVDYECGDDAMYEANQAGVNLDSDGEEASWSQGPLIAQQEQCHDAVDEENKLEIPLKDKEDLFDAKIAVLQARQDLTDEQKDVLGLKLKSAWLKRAAAKDATTAALSEAWAQVASGLTALQTAANEVIGASAEYDSLKAKSEQAIARSGLDLAQVATGVKARYALHRQFQSYDLWRARALLESARRLAVAARRAIERRFVVDLSTLTSSQAFVEAPSVWADEVYENDLDAPSVVGLTATPQTDASNVYPNKLNDYVTNLELFVQGYTASYPTSVASPDTEVLTIDGPDLRREVQGETGAYEVVDPHSAGWTFYCESTDNWISHPGFGQIPLTSQLATACGGSMPTKAKYSFSLDPWGRMNRFISNEAYAQRHNVRWRRFAVNVVGSGVRNCAAALDPTACYSESFLRYDLSHVGPALVTNYANEWRSVELPQAFVEGAKAWTAEEWLDPVANTWTQPSVSNVARTELFTRPVGGSYDLVLDLTPDIRLERIERIQLLAELDYWVRQE